MTIFFYKRLTRNPEIGNTPVWVLSNIWRLGLARDTKFGSNVSNEKLLNAANCQGYNFYHFWVIKVKATGGKITSPIQIKIKSNCGRGRKKVIRSYYYSCPELIRHFFPPVLSLLTQKNVFTKLWQKFEYYFYLSPC